MRKKQRIVCPSNPTSIGHGLPSLFQLQNVYARQCVGATRLQFLHNIDNISALDEVSDGTSNIVVPLPFKD